MYLFYFNLGCSMRLICRYSNFPVTKTPRIWLIKILEAMALDANFSLKAHVHDLCDPPYNISANPS